MSIPNPAGRIRWLVGLAALLCASLLALQSSPAAGAAERRVEVIVQMDAGAKIPPRTVVRQAGGRITARLSIVNGFSARIPARKIRALAAIPGVRRVTRNAAVEAQDVRASDVTTAFPFSGNAPQSWNTDVAEATGKGVGVAVIDTGIAGDLPDFRVSTTDSRSRVVASAIIHPDAVSAGDSYGHGTHVAGIIAGNSWNRGTADLSRGKYLGIAPEANLIDVKVSDELGNATVLDVIVGLQFVVDHKDVLGIRVVNLSLESTQAGSYKTDPLDAAVESAWFHGLVVVASAGNRGVTADAVSYAPGNDPYVISVGAVDDAGTKADSDDLVAPWSARGTTQDGIAKPELHAPGARIVSNLAPGSQFSTLCPTCLVTGGMIRAGGTSMSAPMVSGAAALLLQKYPQLTPNQVKGVLMASARILPGGIPAVDAFAGIRRVAGGSIPVANAGLVPNSLVDPATGAIDYTRSSWSRSSWSAAEGPESASWARSSWSRSSWSSTDPTAVDPSRSSWSRSSWSTSWTK
jgi:serine protease AprX